MRKLLYFVLLIGVAWFAFAVGREYGRLEVPGAPTVAGVPDSPAAADSESQREVTLRRRWQPGSQLDTTHWAPAGAASTPLSESSTITATEAPGTGACGRRCGVQRWAVKTLSEADWSRDTLRPVDVSVAALAALPRPAALPAFGRVEPVETTVYRVRGYLAAVEDESDGDVHLVLFDPEHQRTSIIAEIPDPRCAGVCRSGFAQRFAEAREQLYAGLQRLPAAGADDRILIEIVGVGFFDHPHGQLGAAPNLFELHPVLNVRFP